MTQQVSSKAVVDIFKEVYGDINDLIPQDMPTQKMIPFSTGQKTGDKYIEAVTLSRETGITFAGYGNDAFDINPARAGAVKQVEVSPYFSVLGSILPYSMIMRATEAGKVAFLNSTKYITKNNIRSHNMLLEAARLYGKSTYALGKVSYATATYRGISFTNGTGTLVDPADSATYAFTTGVNTTEKLILFAPGNFAAGLWTGNKGVRVEQVATASGLVVAAGSLVSVNSYLGFIEVDFTPIAATSTTSHFIRYEGMSSTAGEGEMVGIQKILTTRGDLFGINNLQWELFRGYVQNVAAAKLTLGGFVNAFSNSINAGATEGEYVALVNPRTFGTMVTDQAALRQLDYSYSPEKFENGVKDIEFQVGESSVKIRKSTIMMEGSAMCLKTDSWMRSGSAEVSFNIPGLNKEVIFPLENQAGWCFRSVSDQYLFCHSPVENIWFTGINDEAT